MFLDIILASISITLLSLVGVIFFGARGHMRGAHGVMLPIAVGVFLGIVFFELLPETFEASHEWGPIAVLVGFLGFYLLSHFLDTYHHHHADAHDGCVKSGAKMLLIGDAVHNFADGIVIASAFMIDPTVGILTTIGIALHEIPQEIAEFGVLLQSGYSRKKALLYNLISASSVIVGATLTYVSSALISEYVFILTGIAAGNLLYIATTDLIPELRASHRNHFYRTFIATILGVVLIGTLVTYSHEEMAHHEDVPTSSLSH